MLTELNYIFSYNFDYKDNQWFNHVIDESEQPYILTKKNIAQNVSQLGQQRTIWDRIEHLVHNKPFKLKNNEYSNLIYEQQDYLFPFQGNSG